MNDATAVANLAANFDNTVDVKDFKFRFKKDKMGNQRPTIELKSGVPSVEGFIKILESGGKALELLQEAASDVIRGAYTAYFGDNETATAADAAKATTKFKVKDVTTGVESEVELPAFTWEAIANQPASDRRASTIDDAEWEAFGKDYADIMPALTNKTAENVSNAILVFTKKFSPVKTNKEVLKMLKAQLAIYVNNTKKGEQFAEILELLDRKVDAYLAANDVELLIQNL